MTERALRLLLVEDNELDARSLTRRLHRLFGTDHELEHHTTLAEGLTAAADKMFDCILLDLSLPDSEGLLGVEKFLDVSSECPLVVLTGLADPDVAVKAVERGAQDYLPKNILDDELLGRSISYAITRHQAEVRLRVAHEKLEVLGERQRIARDLHDTVIQQLFATGMSLQRTASSIDDDEHRRRVVAAVDDIDEAIKDLRDAIFGMKGVPSGAALDAEVRTLVATSADLLGHTPRVRIDGGLGDIVEAVSAELVPTLNEALSNVARHAIATATEIHIEVGDIVRLTVEDNGVGVRRAGDLTEIQSGNGLDNLAHRAAELGGSFHVGPGLGGGTRLVWEARNS